MYRVALTYAMLCYAMPCMRHYISSDLTLAFDTCTGPQKSDLPPLSSPVRLSRCKMLVDIIHKNAAHHHSPLNLRRLSCRQQQQLHLLPIV